MKKIVILLMAALMLFVLTGCGNKAAEPVASTLETPLIDLVTKTVPGTEEMANLPLIDLEDIIGIEASEYTEAVYMQSTALEGGEAVVLRAVDAEAAEGIVAMLENYRIRRCEETQNYVPELYKLLSETSVQRKNNTVALIVTEKAADIANKLLAGE
ncbi:MAG: DUF4358 domain-containing protein [Clostridiales bacterium]|nr:DUF4358 domain-containing protein [Clostridiales bacterium]